MREARSADTMMTFPRGMIRTSGPGFPKHHAQNGKLERDDGSSRPHRALASRSSTDTLHDGLARVRRSHSAYCHAPQAAERTDDPAQVAVEFPLGGEALHR